MSKTPPYRWADTERVLSSFCTVREVIIDRIGGKHAEGLITCCDYAEGIVFTERWTAGLINDGWTVGPADDHPFTACSDLNVVMAKCIAEHITHHLMTGEHEVIVPVYGGKMEKYTGHCRCVEVEGFGARSSINLWHQVMDGYAHPRYCFECRCGARWWFNTEQERFCRVPDPAAWVDVTIHDGVFTRLIVEKEEGMFQLMTLRREEGVIFLLEGF